MVWDGDSQTLSADRVYNNAKITWSTYAQSGNLSVSECWTLPTDINETALNIVNGRTIGDSVIYSYYYNNDHAAWGDSTNCGFTIWTSDIGKNAAILMPRSKVKYYKIVPQYDGSESEGIAIHWPGVHVPLRDLGRVDWVKMASRQKRLKAQQRLSAVRYSELHLYGFHQCLMRRGCLSASPWICLWILGLTLLRAQKNGPVLTKRTGKKNGMDAVILCIYLSL